MTTMNIMSKAEETVDNLRDTKGNEDQLAITRALDTKVTVQEYKKAGQGQPGRVP